MTDRLGRMGRFGFGPIRTTHWGSDGELHPGTLDDCQYDCCNERRAMATASRERK